MRHLCAALALTVVATAAATAASADSHCQPVLFGKYLVKGPQEVEVVEDIRPDAHNAILGLKFGALIGPYAKVFLFIRFEDGCFAEAVSLGSYDLTNKMADEMGTKTGERLYHLDHYSLSTHATLGMFDAPLSYDAVRARAMELLN